MNTQSKFNEQYYIALENAIKNRIKDGDTNAAEDLELLKAALMSFFEYAHKVEEQETEKRFATGILKGREYQNRVTFFDETRHNAHEKAIINVKILNRLGKSYGTGIVFTGDESIRYEIGDFCGEVSQWFFVNRGD